MPANFVQRHPLLVYFTLTFALSWGGVLLVIGPGGLPGTPEAFERLLPAGVLAMLLGPSLIGLLMTGLVHGRTGYRDLMSRLLRWRVGLHWWAVALLTGPVLVAIVLFVLSAYSPVFRSGILASGNKPGLLLFGLAVGVGAGVLEDLGWTGFAMPPLRRRFGVLATGVILGVVWAAWHLLAAYWGSGTSQAPVTTTSFLFDPFLFLVGYRVLMVWVYEHTAGSLPVAMLMHGSLTATSRILAPASLAGVSLLTYDLLWASVLWVAVAAVVRAKSMQLTHRPA